MMSRRARIPEGSTISSLFTSKTRDLYTALEERTWTPDLEAFFFDEFFEDVLFMEELLASLCLRGSGLRGFAMAKNIQVSSFQL